MKAVPPDSKFRIAWDLFGMMLMVCDAFVFLAVRLMELRRFDAEYLALLFTYGVHMHTCEIALICTNPY